MTNEDMAHALSGKDLRADCVQVRYTTEVTTMRDQFAMAALTALGQSFCQEWRNPNDVQIKWMADGAYKVADAMLLARGGK